MIGTLKEVEEERAQVLYFAYQNVVKFTRQIRKLYELRKLYSEHGLAEPDYYEVKVEWNKEIELYMRGKEDGEQDEDLKLVHISIGTSPYSILNEY